jgi:hypothetical protein
MGAMRSMRLHSLVPWTHHFWLADFRMASTICRTKWNGLARPTVAATLVAGGFELLWPDTEASDFEMKNQLFAMAANITSAATPQVITHASGLAKFNVQGSPERLVTHSFGSSGL